MLAFFIVDFTAQGQSVVLDSASHYLRNGEAQEWSTFPLIVREKQLRIEFESAANKREATIALRQFNVKQNWRVFLNDTDIGGLVQDESGMKTYFTVPPQHLRKGQNKLLIKVADNTPDDIAVGDITLDHRSLHDILNDAQIEIHVVDRSSDKFIPSRITIVDDKGTLQPVSAAASTALAVRTGYVYAPQGNATISLPHGRYTIYAGRGFEYSIDSMVVDLTAGQRTAHTFQIRREVETTGWISSDTHIHTFTHSRHGDATVEERAITLAAEGIELPVMTDHNQNIDISDAAKAAKVSGYFTPVTGNEVTTKVGHFNIFRTDPKQAAISADVENWNDLQSNIGNSENRLAVILNHGRDIHNGFRPFDPSHHISSAGYSTLNWAFPANAMEVINSGSQQTNIMTLYNDWFGMLNRGYFLTPVGSSDSHDVTRFTVGQGRTYIRSEATDASRINVEEAISNFLKGKVLVSLGLFVNINVAERCGPGDLCSCPDVVDVSVEVLGPAWAHAQHVSLYMNGVKLEEKLIENSRAAGEKWKGKWSIPRPTHDVFLVAIAEGDGARMPFWPIAEPYQPMSIDWTPRLLGSTGAVWIDCDGNNRPTSAHDYARMILRQADNDPVKIIGMLSSYHESVAVQAAVLMWENGIDLNSEEIQKLIDEASPAVKNGVTRALDEIRLLR